MRIYFLTLILVALTLSAIAQHYTLHSATKGVIVNAGGKSVAAAKGMQLKSTDYLVIPEGGSAEILNSLDKRIYTSVRPGKVSVTKLIIEARQSAADKLATVGGKINIGRKGSVSGKRVYEEKGMVIRAISVTGEESECPDSTMTDSPAGLPEVEPYPCCDSCCSCGTLPEIPDISAESSDRMAVSD